jgi:hypothetical protein
MFTFRRRQFLRWSNDRVIGELWIGNDMEGGGYDVIETLSRNLPEKKHEEPETG